MTDQDRINTKILGLLQWATQHLKPMKNVRESIQYKDIMRVLAVFPDDMTAMMSGTKAREALIADIEKCMDMNSDNESAYRWIHDRLTDHKSGVRENDS